MLRHPVSGRATSQPPSPHSDLGIDSVMQPRNTGQEPGTPGI